MRSATARLADDSWRACDVKARDVKARVETNRDILLDMMGA